MTRRERAAALAVAGLLLAAWSAGCSSDSGGVLISSGVVAGPTGGTTNSGGGVSCGDEGRTFFEANVSPFIDNKPSGDACAKCHSAEYKDDYGGPDFLGASPAEFYDKLTAQSSYVGTAPENSLFLRKGLHTGPAFTADQKAKVEEWLSIEATERFGTCTGEGGESTPPIDCKTSEDILAAFGECMTLDDWKASKMQDIATQDTLKDGPCFKCHASGTAGNYMTQPISDPDIEQGFSKMRKLPALLNLVAWPTNSATECGDIKPSYRWRDKGFEGNHPKYVLLEEHTSALDAWFNLTYEKWKNGSCAP